MVLDAIPLLPNGKIDRKALPLAASQGAARTCSRLQPLDEFETRLAQIWCEILGIEFGRRVRGFLRAGRSLLARRPSARPC